MTSLNAHKPLHLPNPPVPPILSLCMHLYSPAPLVPWVPLTVSLRHLFLGSSLPFAAFLKTDQLVSNAALQVHIPVIQAPMPPPILLLPVPPLLMPPPPLLLALVLSPLPAPNLPDATENIFDGYLSDVEDDAFVLGEELDDWYDENHTPLATKEVLIPAEHATECSMNKWHRLDVPVREQREHARKLALEACMEALKDIRRIISSKKHKFEGGENGLQAYCARAIQACLHAMVNKKMGAIESSQAAAIGMMMAKGWGG